MKNLKDRKMKYLWKGTLMPAGIFMLLLVLFLGGVFYLGRFNREQELMLTKQAISKAVVQCYAIEGMYPAELSYLEDNYYLRIDYDNYYVFYDCISSNLMPEIEVFGR